MHRLFYVLKISAMKRALIFLFSFAMISSSLLAQESSNDKFLKKFSTGIDIINDFVMDAPDDIEFRSFNPGVNVYGLYTFPINESNFAFALGAGLGMHNLHSNGLLSDTASISFFTKFPDKDENDNSISYKKNKLALTYLDFPFELRFKSDNGIRFAVGFKIGILLNAHTKFKGDDPVDGDNIKIKESGLPNFQSWRFGPSVQIGYKWVNLTGFYSTTRIFEENAGPEIFPVSIGIALRPF